MLPSMWHCQRLDATHCSSVTDASNCMELLMQSLQSPFAVAMAVLVKGAEPSFLLPLRKTNQLLQLMKTSIFSAAPLTVKQTLFSFKLITQIQFFILVLYPVIQVI